MSNKIGLYFKNTLPNTIPSGEDFSFYFIKNNIQETIYLPDGITSQVSFEFNNIFLGKKNQDNSSSFFQINKLNNFYFKTINGITAKNNQGYINLTLDDVVKYGGTSNVMKINNTFLFSDTTDTTTIFFGSYKAELVGLNNADKKSYIKNKFDKTIFVGHFGYNNLNANQKFANSTIFANKLFINYQTVNNSIFIGNDINVQDISTVNIYDNNLNIGGSYIDTVALSTNAQNKIEGNIFIKNLGYGNIANQFILTPKLNLSNIDATVNYTILEILYRNPNGNVERIQTNNLFKPLNDRIDSVQTSFINLNSTITNQGNNITGVANSLNEFKSIYNFNIGNRRQFISFVPQSNYENNSFSINLNDNNTDFYNNIFIAKHIDNEKSYVKFNSKIYLNNLFIPKTSKDPLFNNKLTFNENTGEIGYDYDNDKSYIFDKNFLTTLGKNINVKVIYNQYNCTFHIEFLDFISITGYETITFTLNLTNLMFRFKNTFEQPSFKYSNGSGSSEYFQRGEMIIETFENQPNRIYLRSLISNTMSIKIAHSMIVPTNIE